MKWGGGQGPGHARLCLGMERFFKPLKGFMKKKKKSPPTWSSNRTDKKRRELETVNMAMKAIN